jgi:PEP-CTERM motif
VTTGMGTNSITWGDPCDGVTNCFTSPGGITPPSGLTFTASPFITEIDEAFVLGEIEFFNGTIMPGTEISQVTLLLDGFQITPTPFAGGDSRVISIVNTANTSDPIASADRATIPFAIFPAGNEFGVLESQSATATLLGKFSEVSNELLYLDILGFGEAISPNGFVDGIAPSTGAPSAVPLPGTIILLGSGLVGLVGFRRKRFEK